MLEIKYLSSVNQNHIIGVALHPNYKSMKIFENEFLSTINFNVETKLLEFLYLFDFDENDLESEKSSSSEEITENDFMDTLEVPSKKPKQETACDRLINEYQKFKACTISKKYENPLDYWKNSEFYMLKLISKSVFVVQASSAEPERHNSAAGQIVTYKRSLLLPERVEDLVMYNEFLKNK